MAILNSVIDWKDSDPTLGVPSEALASLKLRRWRLERLVREALASPDLRFPNHMIRLALSGLK